MRKIIYILLLLLFFAPFCLALNLDEKIGQMIIIGYDTDDINSKEFNSILKKVEKSQISGVILFKKNIKSKKDLIKMNNLIKSKNNLTPIVSIDNEGGQVERIDFIHNLSAFEINKKDENSIKKEYSSMAKNLKDVGINCNFAPVVDLGINEKSIIVKKQRAYSKNPNDVIRASKIFVDEHNKNKIMTTLKHFPGHGSVTGDTHKGFVDSTSTFKKEELEPYYKLINNNKLNCVMVSHIFNSDFDNTYPASLSAKTIKGKLINEIGYNGVVVSDDYDMGAIRKNYNLEEIVVNSINAGVDLMIFSNNLGYKDINIDRKINKIVKKNLKSGKIQLSEIDNSINKIIELKKEL